MSYVNLCHSYFNYVLIHSQYSGFHTFDELCGITLQLNCILGPCSGQSKPYPNPSKISFQVKYISMIANSICLLSNTPIPS
jgi:hypothetical protein